jgi:hypothetical protein
VGLYGASFGYGYRPSGTYYAGDAALTGYANALYSGPSNYPYYNAAMYSGYAGAWSATNMASPSLYTNPGYSALAGQLGMSDQPTSYDYGGNIVAHSHTVYINGSRAGTPEEYANQAAQLATSGRNAQPDPNTKWQPLGVFGMVRGGESSAEDIFQLAVSPQGVIRGNYHNTKTNSVVPIAGAVDPKTQRASWTIGGDRQPVYEAGIANLTKDQTTMLVHGADGQPRQFSLIRLPEPSQGSRNGDGSR